MFGNPSTEEEIEFKTLKRLDILVDVFNKLVEKKTFKGIHLNIGILYTTIESYFIDLERVRFFHKIKFNDKYKKAAFTLKWFSKIRPLMVDKNVADKDLTLTQMLANEIFAIIVALSMLDIDIKNVSDKYISNLIYILRYRNIEGLILASHMYLLECSVNEKNP